MRASSAAWRSPTEEFWENAGSAGEGTLMTYSPDPRKWAWGERDSARRHFSQCRAEGNAAGGLSELPQAHIVPAFDHFADFDFVGIAYDWSARPRMSRGRVRPYSSNSELLTADVWSRSIIYPLVIRWTCQSRGLLDGCRVLMDDDRLGGLLDWKRRREDDL